MKIKAKTCALEGCEVTFTETRGNKLYCTNPHRQRAMWAQRSSGDGLPNVLPPDTEVTYIDYKLPLKAVEGGYGYLGTLGTNADKTHLLCNECGNLYRGLASHIKAAHGMNAKAYKQKFQLMLGTALWPPAQREVMSIKAKAQQGKDGMQKLQTIAHDIGTQTGWKAQRDRQDFAWGALQRRNREGNCPDQVIHAIQLMAQELRMAPSFKEFTARYSSGLAQTAVYHFGSWKAAVNLAGYVDRADAKTYDRVEMLLRVKDFHNLFGRWPATSDFMSGGFFPYHRKTLSHAFGSLHEAIHQAQKLVPEGARVRKAAQKANVAQ